LKTREGGGDHRQRKGAVAARATERILMSAKKREKKGGRKEKEEKSAETNKKRGAHSPAKESPSIKWGGGKKNGPEKTPGESQGGTSFDYLRKKKLIWKQKGEKRNLLRGSIWGNLAHTERGNQTSFTLPRGSAPKIN